MPALVCGQVQVIDWHRSLGDGSTSDAGDPIFGGEISTSQPYNNIMLAGGVTSVPRLASYNGTAFVPLIAGATKDKGSGNEQPIVNATNGLTRRILATTKIIQQATGFFVPATAVRRHKS